MQHSLSLTDPLEIRAHAIANAVTETLPGDTMIVWSSTQRRDVNVHVFNCLTDFDRHGNYGDKRSYQVPISFEATRPATMQEVHGLLSVLEDGQPEVLKGRKPLGFEQGMINRGDYEMGDNGRLKPTKKQIDKWFS